MPAMNIKLDGGGWPELKDNPKVVHLGNDAPAMGCAILPGGMTSGRPSVCFRIDLPDGTIVLAETSARLFVQAAKMIEGRFPGLFDDTQQTQQ